MKVSRVLFPAVYRKKYVAAIVASIGKRPLVSASVFFGAYWITPFLFNLLPVQCGTTIGRDILECILSRSARYIEDTTHLLFALSSATIFALSIGFVRDFHIHVSRLAMARSKKASRDEIMHLYTMWMNKPFHPLALTICTALALSNVALFWHPLFDASYGYWWGNYRNGVAGIVYVFSATALVFFAFKYLIFLVSVSIFLILFSTKHMKIQPFSADGVSGLSAAGLLTVRVWRQAALIAFCVFLVFSTNYLDIAGHWSVWLMAFTVSSVLPFAALAPLAFISLEASRQKARLRRSLIADLVDKGKFSITGESFRKFYEVTAAVDNLRVAPVSGWRFFAISTINLVQVYASVDGVLG